MAVKYPLVLNGTTIEELQSVDTLGGVPTTSGTSILKGNGSGGIANAVAGTDYQAAGSYAPATSGSFILSGNGSGGFSNVTIGTGLSFAAGTLSAFGGGGPTATSAQIGPATVNTTSSSPVTTGLSASITPSSTSAKILVTACMGDVIHTGNALSPSPYFYIYRGGTQVYSRGNEGHNANNTGPNSTVSFQFIDSPSTTSATTYTIYFASAYTNTSGFGALAKSSITLVEVK